MSICVTTQAQVYNSTDIEDSLDLSLVASSRTLEEDLNFIRSVIKQIHGGVAWNQIPPAGPDGISGHVATSSEGIHGSSTQPNPNTLAHRDATGYLRTATPIAAENSTIVATTSFVQQAIATIDLSTATLPPSSIGTLELEDASVTRAKLEAFPGMAVLANPVSTSGTPSFVVPSFDNWVFSRSGSQVGFYQVQTNGISNFAITSDKLADLSVTSGKLASNSVTTAKVLNSSITPQKTSFASQMSLEGHIFFGRVTAAGAWDGVNPAGWVVNRLSTGLYRITHSPQQGGLPVISILDTKYVVHITPTVTGNFVSNTPTSIRVSTTSSGYFEVSLTTSIGLGVDAAFSFLVINPGTGI